MVLPSYPELFWLPRAAHEMICSWIWVMMNVFLREMLLVLFLKKAEEPFPPETIPRFSFR